MPASRLLLPALFVCSLLSLATVGEEAPTTPPAAQLATYRRAENPRTSERQREGTKLTDIVGRFDLAGDRVTFQPASERENYKLLENLALERVGQVLGESRARHEWTISGVLTEYRGTNYLLLNKAVIKSTAEPR